jgi:peptidoglycan-associated lipoprotein
MRAIFSTALLLSFAVTTGMGCASHQKASSTYRHTETAPVASNASPSTDDEGLRARAAERFPSKQPVQGTTVHFGFNDSALTSEEQAKLSEVASALRQDESVQITIAGNTDERGTEEYNLNLGEQRARTARDYLVRLGVQPERVRTISYGEDRPLDTSKTEEGFAANRRDDVLVR